MRVATFAVAAKTMADAKQSAIRITLH